MAEDQVQIVDTQGLILAVARIEGITKCGELLLGDSRVGQATTTPHPSRNPVAYI
ncbi:MAG TPA: hypothetical protein VIJ82_31175 [Streptosporangiaceae bacterium]